MVRSPEAFREKQGIDARVFQKVSEIDLRQKQVQGEDLKTGKHWKELPDDYMVPFVSDPYENCIIVTGGGEEYPQWLGARRPGGSPAYTIYAWRSGAIPSPTSSSGLGSTPALFPVL